MDINSMVEEITKKVMQNMNIKEDDSAFNSEYGKYCDHTVLRAYTPKHIVKRFCDEAKKYGAASVCVNPVHVAYVSEQLKDTDIKTCTVIGFPLGANKTKVKALETSEAVADGADEVDMVLNVGALRDDNLNLVLEDIKGVVDAARGRAKVKVIIETCYLNTEQKVKACLLSELAGADYVKTSTGFGTGGATVEDISIMKKTVGNTMKIKASTGINTREDAIKFVNAGAVRLGTSRTVHIVEGHTGARCASMDNQPPKLNEE